MTSRTLLWLKTSSESNWNEENVCKAGLNTITNYSETQSIDNKTVLWLCPGWWFCLSSQNTVCLQSLKSLPQSPSSSQTDARPPGNWSTVTGRPPVDCSNPNITPFNIVANSTSAKNTLFINNHFLSVQGSRVRYILVLSPLSHLLGKGIRPLAKLTKMCC